MNLIQAQIFHLVFQGLNFVWTYRFLLPTVVNFGDGFYKSHLFPTAHHNWNYNQCILALNTFLNTIHSVVKSSISMKYPYKRTIPKFNSMNAFTITRRWFWVIYLHTWYKAWSFLLAVLQIFLTCFMHENSLSSVMPSNINSLVFFTLSLFIINSKFSSW